MVAGLVGRQIFGAYPEWSSLVHLWLSLGRFSVILWAPMGPSSNLQTLSNEREELSAVNGADKWYRRGFSFRNRVVDKARLSSQLSAFKGDPKLGIVR